MTNEKAPSDVKSKSELLASSAWPAPDRNKALLSELFGTMPGTPAEYLPEPVSVWPLPEESAKVVAPGGSSNFQYADGLSAAMAVSYALALGGASQPCRPKRVREGRTVMW